MKCKVRIYKVKVEDILEFGEATYKVVDKKFRLVYNVC